MAGAGRQIVKLAARHVGEEYRNVLVPKDNAQWKGPWDCAEFASWCVFQVGGFLYGCTDDAGDPRTTEAYTGAWKTDSARLGTRIPIEEAAAIVGAVLLRHPPAPGRMGHIVFCDGSGGTVEAASRALGVIRGEVEGRRWDTGVLVPGISYDTDVEPIDIEGPTTTVYRVTDPPMAGAKVKEIQRALKKNGFNPGPIDGVYGTLTFAAVAAFQVTKGLVTDGEVGTKTAKRLGITLD